MRRYPATTFSSISALMKAFFMSSMASSCSTIFKTFRAVSASLTGTVIIGR